MSAKWPTSVATDADLYVAVNSLQTTLSTALGTSDTSVVLASATGFPVAGGVTIGNEVIFYTGVSGATLTGCTRGADGTTAASHSVGVPVGAAIIAFHHNGLMAEIEAIESSLNLTVNRAVATNSSGRVVAATTTDTELGYVHGVTSAIQTQMDLKAALAGPTFTGTVTIPTPFTIGAVSMTATGTELNYVVGVTSAIQTQLNAKLALAGGTLTGALTINPATSQLILGGVSAGKKVTITAPAPATADRVWTIPDITADGTFAALEGTQTFTGAKTFNDLRGTFGADIAAGSHKLTGLAAGSAAGNSVRFEQLKIIQVASGTSATNFTTTSSTFQTTNLSASITPTSASNKVLVIVSGSVQVDGTQKIARMTIARGGSNLLGTAGQAVLNAGVGTATQTSVPVTMTFLDSPAATTALTYAAQILSVDNATTVEFPGSTAITQSILLIEVAP